MSPVSSITSLPAPPLHAQGMLHSASAQPKHEAELTDSEKKEVEKLKKLDAEVRRHEQAHLTAAGRYGKGPPAYEYRQGPDGRQYAVGGHVEIDTAEIKGDPKATLEKARIIKRAALAPREPSNQDRKVAREAELMAQKAQRELREQDTEAAKTSSETDSRDPQRGLAQPLQAPAVHGYTRTGAFARRPAVASHINLVA